MSISNAKFIFENRMRILKFEFQILALKVLNLQLITMHIRNALFNAGYVVQFSIGYDISLIENSIQNISQSVSAMI